MSEDLLKQYAYKVDLEYISRTPKSRAMFEESSRYISGGVTRETNWWKPYPVFIERGEGCYLYDIDGNEYVDYNGCYTASLLGNNPPEVIKAIQEAAPKLLSAGAPTEGVHQWAKILCDRYASVDKVRFCCSGTEAVMYACKAARAYTGKSKILRQSGSYHGTVPEMAVEMPYSQKGLAQSAGADVIVANLYNKAEIEQLVEQCKDDLAGILLNGAWFSPADDTLSFLRSIADRYGVLLIMDEVLSFRLAMGGAQEYLGVDADITAFGKFLGSGGLACGGFGGRDEIMSLFDFTKSEEPVHHGGTMVANPITVAAGIAALQKMTPELLNRLNTLGNRLKQGFTEALSERGIRSFVQAEGSLTLVGLGERTLDPRRAKVSPVVCEVMRLLGLSMLIKGHFTPANGVSWAITAPMTEVEIDNTVVDFARTLDEIMPLLEVAAPELILQNNVKPGRMNSSVGQLRDNMMSFPKYFLPEKAGDMEAVYQFNITGDDGGEWYIVIKDGKCDISEGQHEKPSCSLTMSAQTALAIEDGDLSEAKALLTGKLGVKGKMKLVSKLGVIFNK